jgi:hypothetical protein
MAKHHDPLDLRGQDRLREDRDQAQKVERDQEKADFAWLMSDKRGRRFMWRMLEVTGVYRSSFTGNSETFFREGARNVGLKLIADIHEFSPDSYTTMLDEQRTK